MIPAPLHPVPPYGDRKQSPAFPHNWRWDEPLEYTPEGFLLPARRSLIERVFVWVWKRLGFAS